MPSESALGVTVSIVSHGQRELVGALLTDLQRLASPAVERVVVTLNIDEEPPAPLAWSGCTVQLHRNQAPLGFGANHNRAAQDCATPWLAILNPDLRLTHDPFAPLLAAAGPRDALLAPRVLEADGHEADFARRLLTPWQLVLRTLGQRAAASPQCTDWLVGAFQLVRREAFLVVGGFDSRFFMYLEDADLCLRLRLAGWQLRRVPQAEVLHTAQRLSRRSPRYFGWHLASLAKHWGSAAYWQYLARRRALRAAGVPTTD